MRTLPQMLFWTWRSCYMLVARQRWIEVRRATQVYRRSKQNSAWWWIFGAVAWKPWHRFISFLQQCHACWDVKDFCIQAWLFVCPWNASEFWNYVMEFLMSSESPSFWVWHRWLSYLTGYGGVWHEDQCPDSGISMGCQVWCNIISPAHEIKTSLKSDSTDDQIPAHITVCLDWCSTISLKVFRHSSCLTFCFCGVFPAAAFLSFPWYFVQAHLTSFSGCFLKGRQWHVSFLWEVFLHTTVKSVNLKRLIFLGC